MDVSPGPDVCCSFVHIPNIVAMKETIFLVLVEVVHPINCIGTPKSFLGFIEQTLGH